ncbi:MAG: BON domain-containing protein [Planctomycetota bacterium]
MLTRNWIAVFGVAALLLPTAAQAQQGAAGPTESPSAQAPSANTLAAQRIANEIHASGRLKNYEVGVQFLGGVAWLSGSVTDAAQAEAAAAIAARVDGVTRVVNQLKVKPQAKPQAVQHLPPAAEGGSGLLVSLADESGESASPATMAAAEPAGRQANYEPEPVPTPQTTQPMPRQRTQRAGRGMRQGMGRGMPVPFARTAQRPMNQRPMNQQGMMPQRGVRPANYGAMQAQAMQEQGGYVPARGMGGASGVSYDSPNMPGYAWPSYAAHPNYSAVTYPKQYSPTAWPYIGPFYPYPQVPLGWRKVALEWDDGWWFLDFSHHQQH